MEKIEDKQTKVLMELTEIIKKYSTDDEKEILEELSKGNPKEIVDEKTLKNLIHQQHKEFTK